MDAVYLRYLEKVDLGTLPSHTSFDIARALFEATDPTGVVTPRATRFEQFNYEYNLHSEVQGAQAGARVRAGKFWRAKHKPGPHPIEFDGDHVVAILDCLSQRTQSRNKQTALRYQRLGLTQAVIQQAEVILLGPR